jgi:hypothetical protein
LNVEIIPTGRRQLTLDNEHMEDDGTVHELVSDAAPWPGAVLSLCSFRVLPVMSHLAEQLLHALLSMIECLLSLSAIVRLQEARRAIEEMIHGEERRAWIGRSDSGWCGLTQFEATNGR